MKGKRNMPSGTVINNVFAPRLHKSNAHAKLNEAQETIDYIEKALLYLVAANGNQDDVFTSISTVSDLLSDFSDATWDRRMAMAIIEYPEDCKDELDETTQL
jgi:hypothetical protein